MSYCYNCSNNISAAQHARNMQYQAEGFLATANAKLRVAYQENNHLENEIDRANDIIQSKNDEISNLVEHVNTRDSKISELIGDYNELHGSYTKYIEVVDANTKKWKTQIAEQENTIQEMEVKLTQHEAREMSLLQEIASIQLKTLIKDHPNIAAKLRGIKPRKIRSFAPVEEND